MTVRGNCLIKAFVWAMLLLFFDSGRAVATGPEFDKIVDE